MKSDKIFLLLLMLIILTTISWITSCTHDAKIGDMPEICFDGDVLPIFATSCAISGCHDGHGESDLTFNNYSDIRSSVVPGNPNASKAYKAIIATWGENKMPPSQPLSLANRTTIRLWIEQGANPTTCPQNSGYNFTTFSNTLKAVNAGNPGSTLRHRCNQDASCRFFLCLQNQAI